MEGNAGAGGAAQAGTFFLVRLVLLLLGLACQAPEPALAQRVPSEASWQTFDTPHFRVSFPEGTEEFARRAAARAEYSFALLSSSGFSRLPTTPINLLVTDNVDYANGTAVVTPWNRIVVHLHPPAGEAELGFHDDWLELVILHELTHIFHLENSGGVWSFLRSIFGREPSLYPQYNVPAWMIEGMAVHFESEGTGAGRERGSLYEMILRTAVLEGTFFPIDRASLGPSTWPGGSTPYIYGTGFLDFLARKYGTQSLVDFVNAYGKRIIPYRLDATSSNLSGESFSGLWSEWADSLGARSRRSAAAVALEGQTEPELITHQGRTAYFPRYSPVDGSLAFTRFTDQEDPEVVVMNADGQRVRGVWTSDLGPASWTAGGELLYTSMDYGSRNEFFSDLYRVDAGGRSRRLTQAARVWEPDERSDGSSIVAVGAAGGTNVLVLVDPVSGDVHRLMDPDPDTYWSTPRWSPDGERIAVGRWHAGNADIVVLDSSGALVQEITDNRAVDLNPVWSATGRYLLFDSDRTGIPNIFAWDFLRGELLRVTNVVTGAFQPTISPDESWIAFSWYGSDGYNIARIPFDAGSWPVAAPAVERLPSGVGSRYEGAFQGGEVRPYSALTTLRPTFWTPQLFWNSDLGMGGGFLTHGRDVAERHEWLAEAILFPESRGWDGWFQYVFNGWDNPSLELDLSQERIVQIASRQVGDQRIPALIRRERTVDLSAIRENPGARFSSATGIGAEFQTYELSWSGEGRESASAPGEIPSERAAWLVGALSTVREYPLSLGARSGVAASSRFEVRHQNIDDTDASRNYWRLLSRGRGYLDADWFGFAPSVFALRVDGGVEGSRGVLGLTVGDNATTRDPDSMDDDGPLLSGGTELSVRGYPAGTQGGNRALAASLEYRFPIALVERGYRLLPLAIERFWGDLFVDTGAAWCPGNCVVTAARVPDAPHPLLSAGAEVIGRFRVGFAWDVTLRGGFAVPLRETRDHTPSFYLLSGISF
ncbi:MAG: hypothetical protein LBG44_00590 [Gemmatimonadota bacterium]|nr:hypothetical protein [Gemmatimonadota bacterium]